MSYYKITYLKNDEEKTYLTKQENERILFSVRKDNKKDILFSFSFRLIHGANNNMNNSLVELYDILNDQTLRNIKIYLVSNNEHESLLYTFDKINNISLNFELYEDTSVNVNDVQEIFETRMVIS